MDIIDELQGEGNAESQPARINSHAFIVRIWNESGDDPGAASLWHGSIDYVGGNRRLYFYNLDSMVKFVLEQTGIRSRKPFDWARRFKVWLRNYARISI